MMDTWNTNVTEESRPAPLRAKAAAYLQKHRAKLPRLTKQQTSALVDMLVASYQTGAYDMEHDWQLYQRFEAAVRSATRALSLADTVRNKAAIEPALKGRRDLFQRNRQAVLEAFAAAGKNGHDVDIELIARECGVSRATAYRYLKHTGTTSAAKKPKRRARRGG